ncbi:MAG: hypothetical protein US57_C0022G0013 [Candidatus Moranbacteria bacterium GW2011_GWC2_37_73]|nr:MAG: hypothetical protein US57_C0022G0013 [Candidatus Moranbacteria bacterium GW2011_GWC2_37_73]
MEVLLHDLCSMLNEMITTSEEQEDDIVLDTTLRPQRLSEYVGQQKIRTKNEENLLSTCCFMAQLDLERQPWLILSLMKWVLILR